MGYHFYQQQLKKLGTCPGYRGTKKRMSTWTDESRAEVVAAYEEAEPTAENSMEIVKQIAEDMDESANGVRMILTRAGVYIKKATASQVSKENGKTGTTRVSKAAAQEALSGAIRDAGHEVDDDIISKLTGKAAVYFTKLFTPVAD